MISLNGYTWTAEQHGYILQWDSAQDLSSKLALTHVIIACVNWKLPWEIVFGIDILKTGDFLLLDVRKVICIFVLFVKQVNTYDQYIGSCFSHLT